MPRPPTILSDPDLCTRAVTLVKQGHRLRHIARVLGVSKTSAELFLQRFDLYGEDGVMPDSTRKSYSQQTKLDAVQAYLAGGTAMDVARRHGITTASQIYEWTKIYRDHGPDGLAPKLRGRRPKAEVTDAASLTEVQKLAAEVEMLKAENAYLKALAALEAAEQTADEQDATPGPDTDTGTPPHD